MVGTMMSFLPFTNSDTAANGSSSFQRDDYVFLVPFVEDDKLIVLKTIIPSRKATKQYLEKEADDHEA